MWRLVLPVALVGCAVEITPTPTGPDPLDVIWADSIHAGDLIAMVPGTGARDYLGVPIEAMPGDEPVVDVLANSMVASDAIVFEQAIGAAHRAGISNEALEAGAVTFGLWGAGFTRVKHFTYVSYERLHIPIEVLGGENTCATGLVVLNLLNYTTQNADTDASHLYADIQTWLAAHPASTVTLASHSWGGAIAEWLTVHQAAIAATHGPLGAPIPFTISAGVPGAIPNYAFAGPGFRTVGDTALYEIDRPDDPVHAMNPSGDGDGHNYDIVVGAQFLGAYGVTTEALSCRGLPGDCTSNDQ